jgi:hypothetical protein
LAEEQTPFADVVFRDGGFSLPALKWRELLFLGSMRPAGDAFVRDPSRPMPPFRDGDLFPEGRAFQASAEGGRIFLSPAPGGPQV